MARTLDEMFDMVLERKASDIVLVPGAPPVIWVAGRMHPLDEAKLTGEDIEALFFPAMSDAHKANLDRDGDADFSVGRPDVGRFRINLHRQRGTLSAAVRHVPSQIPSAADLKLPPKLLELADLPNGLVLVCGGTGVGKSTTLAAMLEYINQSYAYHIITLEDPVEFTFNHKRSVFEQREIGTDCPSFASALRHVVRQKPDVIFVGEMRDLETMSAALTAAETGHLVLASLHTSAADEAINRIVDVFSGDRQVQIRVQLADTLRGVICQTLLHDETDGGLVPAIECMMATQAVKRAIRDRQTHLLRGIIETGSAAGMCLMDGSIAQLVKQGRVSQADAMRKARDPLALQRMIG
ncbi:MAG: type IV pilus twitching motility protein PilT [Planctomycetota bacterium]|jgi:twitching motility protein PilT